MELAYILIIFLGHIYMLVSFHLFIKKKGPGKTPGPFVKYLFYNTTLLIDPGIRTKIIEPVRKSIVKSRNHFFINLTTKIEIKFKIEII